MLHRDLVARPALIFHTAELALEFGLEETQFGGEFGCQVVGLDKRDQQFFGTKGPQHPAPRSAGPLRAVWSWLKQTTVCHERTDERRCDAVQEMRVGPSEPAVRTRLQTTASCDGQEPWW